MYILGKLNKTLQTSQPFKKVSKIVINYNVYYDIINEPFSKTYKLCLFYSVETIMTMSVSTTKN